MSLNPQVANEIAHGASRIRSFVEQIQPGQGRRMPNVAGVQREGNTPMSSLPMTAGASPMMPQTIMPTMPQAQAAGVSLMGLRSTTAWPMWLKVLLPMVVIGGLGLATWGISRHYKRRNVSWPEIG